MIVMSRVWDQINADADANPVVNNAQTIGNFNTRLCEFIAVHSMEQDQQQLVQFLCKACKPLALLVQSFWCKLCKFNLCVGWLPGAEPPPNDQLMHQAFHDDMPPTWREHFSNAGISVVTITAAQVVHFDGQQPSTEASIFGQ